MRALQLKTEGGDAQKIGCKRGNIDEAVWSNEISSPTAAPPKMEAAVSMGSIDNLCSRNKKKGVGDGRQEIKRMR